MSETTPAVSVLDADLEQAAVLLKTPEAQAILAAAEKRAAEIINALPSQSTGTPGWQTSEFWSLVVFFLLALATMLAGVVPPRYALIAQAVVTGLYQISRGLTKHGTGN